MLQNVLRTNRISTIIQNLKDKHYKRYQLKKPSEGDGKALT